MSTELEILPEKVEIVETPAQAPDPIDVEKAARLSAEAEASKERKKVEKLQERINRLTAERKNAPAPAPAETSSIEAQIESKAQALAEEKAKLFEFNRETSRILDKGKAAFPDFLEKVSSMKAAVIDPTDSAATARYTTLINGIMETADGNHALSAKIIHELGSDPDRAEELARMSPIRLGRELSRMAEAEPPEPTSRVPKPPSVVVGGRSPSFIPIDPTDTGRSDKLSTQEWMARRAADVKAKREQGVRGVR